MSTNFYYIDGRVELFNIPQTANCSFVSLEEILLADPVKFKLKKTGPWFTGSSYLLLLSWFLMKTAPSVIYTQASNVWSMHTDLALGTNFGR